MVKLASARESRLYGPRLVRNRAEYINAGIYVFATMVLLCGFATQFSSQPKVGLVLLLIALFLIVILNLHDLLAHLAGFDYRVTLLEYDQQLGLVEFAVPVVQADGALFLFLGILFLLIQRENYKLEKHALNMLLVGPALWVLGSIHNSCQIYERADGHVQILHQSVQIPFLIGSILFLVAAVLNSYQQSGPRFHGLHLLGTLWVCLGIVGSLTLFVGGLTNLFKVFKMQQIDGLRLEKLRGGAQERLALTREGHVPLLVEDQRSRKRQSEEMKIDVPGPGRPTLYKNVLVGQGSGNADLLDTT